MRGEAPAPLHPLSCFNRLGLLPTLTPFFRFMLSCSLLLRLFCICIVYLGSYYRIAGGGAAPSPLHPPTRFYFLTGSSGYLLSLFFSGSFYLYWYPSRLVPMCFFLGTHCGGRRCALPPAPPHPLLCFNRLLLLPTLTSFLHMHRLFGFILSHCGGRRLHPPTRFYFLTGSSGYLLSLFFSGSFYLYWYPSRLVPMCFFLGTHCGGRCCALPPAPPHPLLCFNRLLLLPTLTSFLHMHRLFGFILSHCRGRRLHPPTRFDVLTGSGCSLLSLFFSGSCYLY